MKQALLGLTVLLAMPAFARSHKKSKASAYHCTRDGEALSSAHSSKACKKAHGKWEKKNDLGF